MLQIQLGLMAVIASFTFLGCTNQEATKSLPSPNSSSTTTTTTTTTTSKTISPSPDAKAPNKPIGETANAPTKGISIGNIKDLADSQTCGNSKVIYAYGETSNYRIYICADNKEPDRPRYYISRNKDGSGGLEIEAMNYNPQRTDVIEFKNDAYLYTLEAPTTQNPEPVLRVTFPNGKLTEEQLLRYLGRTNIANLSNSSSEPLQYVLQNRESLGICKDNFRAEDGQKGMGSKAFPITDKKYLVQIQCFLAAYQGAFEYVLWIDESPKPRVIALEFDSFQEGKDGAKPSRITDRAIGGMPRFNLRSQTMTNFTKFRGVGDCASSAVYKLEGDRMVLQEYRAKYACDGKYTQDLPIIYP